MALFLVTEVANLKVIAGKKFHPKILCFCDNHPIPPFQPMKWWLSQDLGKLYLSGGDVKGDMAMLLILG